MCGYSGMFVSALPDILSSTLELVWRDDATALVLEGERERHVDVGGLITLAAAPPAGVVLGDTARVAFAVVALAERSVDERLVYPQLTQSGGSWFAFWGPVLDDTVRETLS